MSLLRVGLIGLGEVAQAIHPPTLADLRSRFAIAGAYDPYRSPTELIRNRHASLRVFGMAAALIQDPAINAVFILFPDEIYSRYVRLAMEADKHILLEKPACLTLREMDELLSLAARHHKILFVAYMRRCAANGRPKRQPPRAAPRLPGRPPASTMARGEQLQPRQASAAAARD